MLFAMMALTFVDVIGRYVVNSPLLGAYELTEVLLALVVFGAVPLELSSAYTLSVLPLFTLMGALATMAGLSGDLFRASNAIFAGMRGSLAMAAVGASAAFGAVCGSSLATAATMSRISIPPRKGSAPK